MRRTRSSNRPLVVITNWRDRRHPEAGGAEEVCEQLASRFAQSGMQVVLLTASVPGAPNKEEMDGFTIVRRGGRFSVYPWALLWLLAAAKKDRRRDRLAERHSLLHTVGHTAENPRSDVASSRAPGSVRSVLFAHHVENRQVAREDWIAARLPEALDRPSLALHAQRRPLEAWTTGRHGRRRRPGQSQ